jgi:phage gp46-like protein
MITHEKLLEKLDYDRFSGVFTWKDSTNQIPVGSEAGTLYRGYRRIAIDGRKYSAHKLAWLYETGEYPIGVMDHINGVRDDNRISNIRVVSVLENNRNQKMRKTNRSGVMGVSYNKKDKKWCANISEYVGGVSRKVFLGGFNDIKDAISARKSAEKAFGYHKNHGRASV